LRIRLPCLLRCCPGATRRCPAPRAAPLLGGGCAFLPTKAPAAAALGGMKQRETAGYKHHNNERAEGKEADTKQTYYYLFCC